MISKTCRKRILGDIKLLHKEPIENIETFTDLSDMLNWYFLIKGVKGTEYEGGYYLGQIMLDPQYPYKPPNYTVLTPNGRFLINDKICMSNTGFHEDEWSSLWNLKTILLGFLSIMMDNEARGISHIKRSTEERKALAMKSLQYNCTHYPDIMIKFARLLPSECFSELVRNVLVNNNLPIDKNTLETSIDIISARSRIHSPISKLIDIIKKNKDGTINKDGQDKDGQTLKINNSTNTKLVTDQFSKK